MEKQFRTLTAANAWLIKNWRLVDKHAKVSTKKLVGRTDVAKAKRERKGRTEELWMGWDEEAGFIPRTWAKDKHDCVLAIGDEGWPGLIPVRVRITEIVPKSKKAAKRKGSK